MARISIIELVFSPVWTARGALFAVCGGQNEREEEEEEDVAREEGEGCVCVWSGKDDRIRMYSP